MNSRLVRGAVWSALLFAPFSVQAQRLAAPAWIPETERLRLRAQRPQRLQKAAELFQHETARAGLAAGDAFEAKTAAEDTLGRLHVRYERRHQGLRVLGGDVKVSLSHAGSSLSVARTKVRPLTHGSIGPTVAKTDAVDMLLRELRIDPSKAETNAELLIESAERNGQRDRLAWLISVQAPDTDHTYYLTDASTGRKFDSWAAVQTDSYTAHDGWGTGYYNKRVVIPTAFNESTNKYELMDPTRGNTRVYDFRDRAPSNSFNGEPYEKTNNDWGNGRDWEVGDSTSGLTGQSAAVDAMYAAKITWDLLLNVFGRESHNGNGSPFRLRVHARKDSGSLYGDAHWNTDCDCATFGDGAESESGHRADFATVAHELGHGYFYSGVGGDDNSGEKAGLNEGTGDILAAIANHYRVLANGQGTVVPDGPDVSLFRWRNVNPWGYKRGFGGYISGMQYEEEHVQGNVYARMFAILAAGAPSRAEYDQGPPCELSDRSVFRCLISLPQGVAGIGIQKAAQIFHLATVAKMDSSPTFHEARQDWLAAAEDLYGENSPEYRSVMTAFAAIAVGEAPADTQTPTVSMGLPVVDDGEQSVFVSVSTDDDIGVRTMDIRRNAFLMKGLHGDGFVGFLDLRGASFGSFALNATVRDAAGRSAAAQRNITYRGANYLIRDGGFELESSDWNWHTNADLLDEDNQAFLGSNYAAFTGDSWIRQRVSVPAGTTKLTLGFRVAVNRKVPAPVSSTLAVEIMNEAGTQVTDLVASIPSTVNTYDLSSNHYKKYTFNLTGYAGKTVWVRFRSDGSSSDPRRFRVDNVFLTYEGPVSAQFTAVVDEADRSVTFRVKNVTGTNLLDRIEIGSPGFPGRRMPASGVMAVDTSEFNENITYQVTARLLSAAGVKLAEIGPVAVRVKPSHHRLSNTGFEAANALFWTTTGNAAIVSDAGQDKHFAYMGGKYARIGGRGVSHVATLYQRAIMPDDFHSAKLSFRLRIESTDVSGDSGDYLRVKILDHSTGAHLKTFPAISGNTETAVDENGDQNVNHYRKFTYNLSEFKGRIIRVVFEGVEDTGVKTTFYIDNATVVYTQLGVAGN